MLARALARRANLLVLDEPTNDLDLETLDLLEELLAGYAGTVLLVSHDRDFIDRVVTSVIAAEGEGTWVEYAGGYSDMLAQKQARLAAKAGRNAPASAARPPPSSSADTRPARQRRMSFNEKRALDLLPDEITRLEARVARLRSALSDPDLYRRDPAAFGARMPVMVAVASTAGLFAM